MAKDPSVLFYVQDFLIGVSLLTPLQKGHYITLLCYQQQSETGSLRIEEIKFLMKGDFSKQWPVIKNKFREDENGFYNIRMRLEIEKRKKFSNKQRENISKRWNRSGIDDGNTMVLPLENENENENVYEKGVQGEKHNSKQKPPEQTFSESGISDKNILSEKLKGSRFENADADFYFEKIKIWSEGKTRSNWLKTAKLFMLNDLKSGKLVTNDIKHSKNGKQTTSEIGKSIEFDKP